MPEAAAWRFKVDGNFQPGADLRDVGDEGAYSKQNYKRGISLNIFLLSHIKPRFLYNFDTF